MRWASYRSALLYFVQELPCDNILTRLQVKDHVQSLPIVRHLLIQACQVELVLYVVLIHLLHTHNRWRCAAINGIDYAGGTLLPHTHVAALRKRLTRLRDAAANIERMELKLDLDCVSAYLSEGKKLLHNETALTLQFLGFSWMLVLSDRRQNRLEKQLKIMLSYCKWMALI